jgi:replicative DNA helicase
VSIERAAEQAVIGALLLQPGRFAELSEWLQVDDFDGTNERIAYGAIVELHARGEDVTPEQVNRLILEHQPRPLPPADGAFLVGCMQACPADDRVAIYGRMVLESSVRRRIADHAAGLRQRAEQAESADELNRVFFAVDTMRRDIEQLHQREARAHGALAPTPVTPAHLEPTPRDRRHRDSADERATIRALIDQPGSLDKVSTWLHPDDFTDWDCRLVYTQLQAMHRERKPIDPLTVAWETSRVGLDRRAASALASARHLDRAGHAEAAARRVLQRSVQANLIATARQIERAVAASPRANATGAAYANLNDLWPDQRRLLRSGSLGSPATSGPGRVGEPAPSVRRV